MTAVMLSLFLFVMGLGFLYFLERDSYLQLHSDRMARAAYLARSGIEYYAYKDVADPNFFAANVARRIDLSPAEHFEVTRTGTGECRSRGWLQDSNGKVTAERTLMLPANSDKQAMYDPNL